MTASDHLNYRQVEKLMGRVNAGGGFSVKAYGPDVGQEPENKFMVGGVGRELSIYPPEVGHDVEATTEQGMAFAETRENALRGPRSWMGGWHGGNRIALDVSHDYPTTRRGEMRARKAAVRRGEETVGQLGRRTTGGTATYVGGIDNPFYGKTRDLNTETRAWANEPITKRRKAAGPQ